jgi:hypothetical protein
MQESVLAIHLRVLGVTMIRYMMDEAATRTLPTTGWVIIEQSGRSPQSGQSDHLWWKSQRPTAIQLPCTDLAFGNAKRVCSGDSATCEPVLGETLVFSSGECRKRYLDQPSCLRYLALMLSEDPFVECCDETKRWFTHSCVPSESNQ